MFHSLSAFDANARNQVFCVAVVEDGLLKNETAQRDQHTAQPVALANAELD